MLIIMPKKFFVAKSLFGPISLTQKNKKFLNKFASIFATSKLATRKILREFINTSIFETLRHYIVFASTLDFLPLTSCREH